MMKSLRRLTLSLSIVLLLLVALVLLPTGPTLARLIINMSTNSIHIDDTQGSLLSTVTVTGVKLSTDALQGGITALSVTPNLSCLTRRTLCIDELHIAKGQLSLHSANDTSAEASAPSDAPFSLPIAIALDNLHIGEFKLTTDAATLVLSQFTTSLHMADHLHVGKASADKLSVMIPDSKPSPQATQTKSLAEYLTYTPLQLPAISSPLPLSIDALNIGTIEVVAAQDKITPIRFEASDIQFKEHLVLIKSIDLVHPSATYSGGLQGDLYQDYPLTLDGQGQVTLPNNQSLSYQVAVTGDTKNLHVKGTTSGDITTTFNAHSDLTQAALPIALDLSWSGLDYTFAERVSVHTGALQINGELASLNIHGTMSGHDSQAGDWHTQLSASHDTDGIHIQHSITDILAGQITLSGDLSLANGYQFSTQLEAHQLAISQLNLSDYAPSQLSLSLLAGGTYDNQKLDINVSNIKGSGQMMSLPLSVDGSVVISQTNDIWVGHINAQLGDNHIQTITQLFNQKYISSHLVLNFDNIQSPQITGRANGKIDVTGEWQNPQFSGAFKVDPLNVNAGEFLSPHTQNIRGDIEFDGDLKGHQMQFDLRNDKHHLALHVNGQWHPDQYRTTINRTDVAISGDNWALAEAGTAQYIPSQHTAELSNLCWEQHAAHICLDKLLYERDKISWQTQAQALPIGRWLAKLMPKRFVKPATTPLNFDTQGSFTFGDTGGVDTHYAISLSPGAVFMGSKGELKVELDTAYFQGQLTGKKTAIKGSVNSPQIGSLNIDSALNFSSEQPSIEGTLDIAHFALAPFSYVTEQINQLSGELNGQLAIKGDLYKPQLHGDLALKGGALDMTNLPTDISRWDQSIRFDGQHASFDGSFALGGGKGELQGEIEWQDKPKVKLQLTGTDFPFEQRDMALTISPNLSTEIDPDNIHVSGDVHIPYARIGIKKLPESAVSPSADVHLRGEPPNEDPLANVLGNINLVIDKDKTGEVQFNAFGLSAALNGTLSIATHPAVTGYGDLSIINGQYRAYGQNLLIRTGEVQFNGPLSQPYLLVEAIRDPNDTDNNVIAGVRVEGPANRPNVGLFSEPPMNQGSNLAYLLNGSASTQGTEMNQEAYAGILLGFGLSNATSLTGKVGDAIGIDDLSLSTSGQGSDTMVNVSGKIAKNLTLRYGVSVFGSGDGNVPEVALRYQLTQNLYVEAVQGLYDALDLYYQFTLGNSEPSPASSSTQQP